MKTIALTRGLETVVDDDVFEWAKNFSWYAQNRRGYFYAARWDNSVTPRKIVSLHREIMGNPAGKIVDHIDTDTLRNTRKNLRVVSKSQNNQNSKKRSSRSKYRGVRELKRKNKPSKWRATFNHNGKRIDGGCYSSEVEAAKAYNNLVIEHGGLAPLNEVL